MFEKLLSLVPYNPGLLPQLSFYSRRMREEASIRRTGTVFLILAFMLQFFAVLSPPQSTFASGDPDNSLLRSGVDSASDGQRKCDNNTQDFEHILRHFGITCSDVGNAERVPGGINNGARNYWSMGRKPDYDSNEYKVDIPGDGLSLYVRPLKDVALSHNFPALRVRASNNINPSTKDPQIFYILLDCGNLATVGKPPLPQPETFTVTKNPRPVTTHTSPPVYIPPPKPTPTNPVVPVTPTPCPFSPTLAIGDINCKPCDKSTNIGDTVACVVISKSATNVTVGGDANNTTVKAGDVITYTLSAKNNGKATIKNFSFQESLSDVLDYSDSTDLHGGSIDVYKNVSWPNQDIGMGETATHQITVKVKDPIPSTPLDPSAANRFDLTMTNVYGNAINIKLPGAPAKQIEVAATALPNTGPGTSLMIAAAVVILAGYFYSRATLLAKESEIAVKETALV